MPTSFDKLKNIFLLIPQILNFCLSLCTSRVGLSTVFTKPTCRWLITEQNISELLQELSGPNVLNKSQNCFLAYWYKSTCRPRLTWTALKYSMLKKSSCFEKHFRTVVIFGCYCISWFKMILRGWVGTLAGNVAFIARDLSWGIDHDDPTTD